VNELAGAREWVYTAWVDGHYRRLRRATSLVLIAFLFGLPWMRIRGLPALELDLQARTLYAFGGVFRPTDSILLVIATLMLGLVLFLSTALLEPVVSGTAAMSVGTFPESGRSRGFGLVKRAAATIVERATGLEMTEPLSGQRAIAGSVLRSVEPAPRFGLEIGLTLDIAARGHHIVEVSAEFEHRPTGRDLAGVMHRMRQGRDLVGAAWRRIGWRRTISSLVRSIWRRR